MYTKEELESMDNAALVGIADSLGVKVTPSDEKESVIYAILDKVKNKEKERKEEDKDEINKKAEEARERYLQRKRAKNQ